MARTAFFKPAAALFLFDKGLLQYFADLGEVKHMWTGCHRQAKRCRFQQIMATVGHQTAADEGNIARGVKQCQFTHGVTDKDIGAGGAERTFAAQHRPVATPAAQGAYSREALRMSRNQYQQAVRHLLAKLPQGLEQEFLLAFVGAAGDQNPPLRAPGGAYRFAFLDQARWQSEIELEVSADRDSRRRCADRFQSTCIGFTLRDNVPDLPQGRCARLVFLRRSYARDR